MNLRQLEIFSTVVKCRNFSRAAEELFISQPSVSIAIHQLEKDLSTKLLNRSTKYVTPTEAGQLLFDRGNKIISLCENTRREVYEIANPNDLSDIKRSLLINASSLPTQYLLPSAILEFRKHYQNVDINVEMLDSSQVIQQILDHKIDFGIVGYAPNNDQCDYETLFEDKLVLVGKNDLNCNKLQDILASEMFISREKGSGTRNIYENFLKEQNIDPESLNIMTTFSNTTSVLQAVANGLGIAVVSELAAQFYNEQGLIKIIDTDVTMPKRNIYIVKRKNYVIQTVAQLFVNHLKKIYSK